MHHLHYLDLCLVDVEEVEQVDLWVLLKVLYLEIVEGRVGFEDDDLVVVGGEGDADWDVFFRNCIFWVINVFT